MVPRALVTRRSTLVLCAVLAIGPVVACGTAPEAPGGPSMDRETFVSTYVDLRLSALGTPDGVVSDVERARILAEHGVSEDDLLGFADAQGTDPESMKAVWEEVQARLRAAAGEDQEPVDEEADGAEDGDETAPSGGG